MGNGLASDGDECNRDLLSSRSEVGVEEHDGPLVLGEHVKIWEMVEDKDGISPHAVGETCLR